MSCDAPRLCIEKGVDPKELKEKMLALLDERGAQYPAEHNVGHLYKAQPQLKSFYKKPIRLTP